MILEFEPMFEFVLTFAVIVLAMAGLAVGVLAGRGALRGSCGGNAVMKNCFVCKKDDLT